MGHENYRELLEAPQTPAIVWSVAIEFSGEFIQCVAFWEF